LYIFVYIITVLDDIVSGCLIDTNGTIERLVLI